MKIFTDKSLGLRRGKWVSQISHALMKYFLMNATWCKTSQTYIVRESIFNSFSDICRSTINQSSPLEIVWVANSDDLDKMERDMFPYAASIIDHARTELTKPTKTCFAHDDTETMIPVEDLSFKDQEIHTKQVIALSRKIKKETQFQIGAAMSMLSLLSQFKKDGNVYRLSFADNKDHALWLKGAFAKITVKFDDEEDMKSRISEAISKGIHVEECRIDGSLACVVFGAAKSDELDSVTSTLKLY